jgi:hypothetical protein
LAHERNHFELFQRDGIEGHFVDTVENFACPTGRPGALEGIYGNEYGVPRRAFTDQGRNGGIPGETPVPISLTVDLDGLEERRQTSGGQEHVGREIAISEHVSPTGADVGGGHEQLDWTICHPAEVDTFGQDVA